MGGAEEVDQLRRPDRGDAAALELRQNRPAGLVHKTFLLVSVPVADRPDAFPRRRLDDLEHLARSALGQLDGLLVPMGDLLRAFGPAQVLHHRRVAEEPVQEREVVVAPRLDAVPGLAQSISFFSIAWIATRHMISAKTTRTPTRKMSFHSNPYSTASRTSSTHWCSGFSSPSTCAHLGRLSSGKKEPASRKSGVSTALTM